MATDPIKVYDARWEVDDFDDAAVSRLFDATYAYARELGVDTVVLTRDARLAAGHVLELAMQSALRLGFRIFVRPEPISTPQGYFTALWVTEEFPGTMHLAVTASHNPANYIGVKFCIPPVSAIGYDCGPQGGLARIRELYHAEVDWDDVPGATLDILELSEEYGLYSLEEAGVESGELAGLSVVLDTFNGSAGPELYRTLAEAGCDLHPLRLVPDGTFPTGSPNPTSQGKMDDAVALAAQVGAEVVLGIDGDGDRIVFADAQGVLTAGFAFVPILQAAGVSDGSPVLYDPKVSPLALAEWGRLGVKPVLFRNGHSQIKDYMRQLDAPAAAEESGHYYHRLSLDEVTIYSENSALTILLFLKAVAQDLGLMSRLRELQDKVFTTGEFNYQFADDTVRDAALAAVIDHWASEGASRVTHTPDGIDLEGTVLSWGVDLSPGNVQLADGWYSGYLRVATNEKGVVRSYFSAGETARGEQIETATRQILASQFDGKVVE